MLVDVGLDGESRDHDTEVRALLAWLRSESVPGLRVETVAGPGGAEDMSGGQDLVLELLAPGGAGAAVATALMSFVQSRRGTVRVVATEGDRTTEITAGLSAKEARTYLDRLLAREPGPEG